MNISNISGSGDSLLQPNISAQNFVIVPGHGPEALVWIMVDAFLLVAIVTGNSLSVAIIVRSGRRRHRKRASLITELSNSSKSISASHKLHHSNDMGMHDPDSERNNKGTIPRNNCKAGYRSSCRFVLSLAISDLLVGLAMPFHMTFYIQGSDTGQDVKDSGIILGQIEWTCLLRFVLLALACSASACNLIAIAVDRYIAIVYPLHYHRYMNKRVAVAMIFTCWISALIFATIPAYWNRWNTATSCELDEIFTSQYITFIVPPLFGAVVLALSILYWRIGREARAQLSRLLGTDGRGPPWRRRQSGKTYCPSISSSDVTFENNRSRIPQHVPHDNNGVQHNQSTQQGEANKKYGSPTKYEMTPVNLNTILNERGDSDEMESSMHSMEEKINKYNNVNGNFHQLENIQEECDNFEQEESDSDADSGQERSEIKELEGKKGDRFEREDQNYQHHCSNPQLLERNKLTVNGYEKAGRQIGEKLQDKNEKTTVITTTGCNTFPSRRHSRASIFKSWRNSRKAEHPLDGFKNNGARHDITTNNADEKFLKLDSNEDRQPQNEMPISQQSNSYYHRYMKHKFLENIEKDGDMIYFSKKHDTDVGKVLENNSRNITDSSNQTSNQNNTQEEQVFTVKILNPDMTTKLSTSMCDAEVHEVKSIKTMIKPPTSIELKNLDRNLCQVHRITSNFDDMDANKQGSQDDGLLPYKNHENIDEDDHGSEDDKNYSGTMKEKDSNTTEIKKRRQDDEPNLSFSKLKRDVRDNQWIHHCVPSKARSFSYSSQDDQHSSHWNIHFSSLTSASTTMRPQLSKSTIVVLLVLGSFILLWLPFIVVSALLVNGIKLPYNLYRATFSLAMSNSGMNPIIYGWKNAELKRVFLRFVLNKWNTCCKKCFKEEPPTEKEIHLPEITELSCISHKY